MMIARKRLFLALGAALLLARQLCETTGEPVTVVNLDGYKGQ